ncbi:MAG: hypothetical protein ACR2NQ_01500 [Thermodesulfobacteriota bacterium]
MSFCLTGCLSKTITFAQSVRIPSEHLASEFDKYKNPYENAGKVVIVRDSGLIEDNKIEIYVNGKKIATFHDGGQSLVFYLPEGDYVLGAKSILPLATDQTLERALTTEKGKEYFYKLSAAAETGALMKEMELYFERSYLVK